MPPHALLPSADEADCSCIPCQLLCNNAVPASLPMCSEPSEDAALPRRAHSCMLTRPFRLYGCEAAVDVMLEAKGMEQALLFYRDELLLGRKLETPQAPQKVTAAASRRQSVASL